MAFMEITTDVGCRISCSYCPQGKLVNAYRTRSPITRMSFDHFKTCIDKIPTDVGIIFSGFCEPWQNPACTEMLLYAHRRGHKIVVHTTLIGMNVEDVVGIESVPFRNFVVHLPSERRHDGLLGGKDYLKVLEKISESRIRPKFVAHGRIDSPRLKAALKNHIRHRLIYTRSGNVDVDKRLSPVRMRGHIKCSRNLRVNVLLPNGDVVLCSNDFELRHILGNLITSDYPSLFQSEAFRKVCSGLRADTHDILCRYCDMFAYDGDALAAFTNPPAFFLKNLHGVRDVKDLFRLSWRLNLKLMRRLIFMGKHQVEAAIYHKKRPVLNNPINRNKLQKRVHSSEHAAKNRTNTDASTFPNRASGEHCEPEQKKMHKHTGNRT
ncbi:MAG: SPASM domain-containing protein [Candidatus Aminicenantes bacterium]|nr:SPASM domain-containing protein [Candidatus Aminicenantes bacterium]